MREEYILSPVPRLEVFALPGSIERATKKPHAECIIIHIRMPIEYPDNRIQ